MSITSHFDDLPSVSPLHAASRFDPYFDVYGLGLKQHAGLESRTVTLIARSPASPPAQALAMNLSRFQPMSLEVRIIFVQIAPAGALSFLAQTLTASCRQAPETIVRWAKNRALLDAHERLTLGTTLCWTGDSMRRSEDFPQRDGPGRRRNARDHRRGQRQFRGTLGHFQPGAEDSFLA